MMLFMAGTFIIVTGVIIAIIVIDRIESRGR